ncbi:M23 family metallopeptidase [Ancylomarina sp. YFZ004]
MKTLLSFILLVCILLGAEIDAFSQNSDVEITYQKNSDNSVDFNFRKNVPGRFWVNIKFDRLENTSQRSYRGCVEGSSGKVFTLKPKDPNRGIGFSYSCRYHRGKALNRLKNDIIYLLPFKNQTKVSVQKLGYMAKQIGKGAPDSWTAFQFSSENEELVLAARKGLVVEVTDEYSADTIQNFSFISSVNEVLVEHSDGTLARYSGFKRGSIKVKPGQNVYPQEELGLLGRYDSDTDHKLHFCLYYLNTPHIDNFNTEEKKMNRFTYVNPRFHWKGGESIILPRNDYVAESTEKLIMQEFSRREKKKYLKGELN